MDDSLDGPLGGVRVPGSFRDPTGYVFRYQRRTYRAVAEPCAQTLRNVASSGLLHELTDQGLLVSTRFVDDERRQGFAAAHPRFSSFLEHRTLWPITFPYEWSVSMLADAASLTLDLQLALLRRGFALKDASAYNVQFDGCQPTFIDVPSIESPERCDLWHALGQFHRMFTYPLLLCRHHGWELKSCFLSRLDGIDPEEAVRGLGPVQRWRPRWLFDLTLPWLLNRWVNRSSTGIPAPAAAPHGNVQAQVWNLQRLRRKVAAAAANFPLRGPWVDYQQELPSYERAAEAAKKQWLAATLAKIQPARVLDAGCNGGDYSLLAAEAGAVVVAADANHDVVEALYRRLRGSGRAITPVVLDLANPSPAIGYCNQERPAFLERVQVDCVLALALLHHLRISANLSLEAVRDLFARLTTRHLVLEFVPPEDEMFQRLLRFRHDPPQDTSLEHCRQVFGTRFDLVAEQRLPDSQRTLLHWQIRS